MAWMVVSETQLAEKLRDSDVLLMTRRRNESTDDSGSIEAIRVRLLVEWWF